VNRAAVLLLLAVETAAAQAPAPLLWRAPRPLTAQDWICGPGGCDGAPRPPFRFLKEDPSGTTPKVTLRDARDRTWSVKFGAEVIPECFAPRFLAALGYFGESNYFVAQGRIGEVGKLSRARRMVKPDGAFARARFEPRDDPGMQFLQGRVWSWADSPFRGTRELAGLKIAMMLLSNWDAKDARNTGDSNNGVFRVPLEGRAADVFSVFDWGAALGRWGDVLRRDRSDCAGFALDSPHFVTGVRSGLVEFGFAGKHGADLKSGITVEDVRWLVRYLDAITPAELQDGLRASGATQRQAGCWAGSIEQRIAELRAVR